MRKLIHSLRLAGVVTDFLVAIVSSKSKCTAVPIDINNTKDIKLFAR